jgi:trimeric autotransporter adhesin
VHRISRRLSLLLALLLLAVGLGAATPRAERAEAQAQLPPRNPVVNGSITMSNTPANLGWGVIDATRPVTTNEDPEVFALQEIGNTIFVGGTFQTVRNNNANVNTAQPWLAAFDATTGAWISTFRPTLDGTVFDFTTTASGQLVVAGEFTNINGVAGTSGLAAIDPVTGQVNTAWRATVTQETNTNRAVVRAVDRDGDWIYVGGDLSHITGPDNVKQRIYRAGRVRASDGRPDWVFRPRVGGASVWDISSSKTQDRVILGGRFDAVNAQPDTARFAVVRRSDGATLPRPAYTQSYPFQHYLQTVADVSDTIMIGGAEHFFDLYNSNGTLRQRHVTYFGGDFQAIATANGVAYAACHCYEFNYQGATGWSPGGPIGGGIQTPITWIGAYDIATGNHLTSFQPRIGGMLDGPWELHISPANGCLWFGGDVKSSFAPAFWIGGFSKVCPGGDATPPSVPQSISHTFVNGAQPVLTWQAATDNVGVTGYRVYRDGQPIGTVTQTTFTDTALAGPAQYQVTALDAAGNESASLAGYTVTPGTGPTVVVPYASTWRYQNGGTIPNNWTAPGFNDAGWPAGAAQLGWGDGDEATNIDPGPNTNRRTVWFRTSFNVANPAAFTTLTIDLIRDDGAAVYINGTEVVRDNLPAGPLTPQTNASTALFGAAETTPVTFTVPSSTLVAGTNVVAVEVHGSSGSSNNDASFSLRLTAS